MNDTMAQNLLFTEHISWLKNIDQAKSELRELELRLEKAAPQFHAKAMMARVEQFQNRLIRQREVLDELRHEVKQHDNHLETMDSPAHVLLLEHIGLREQYNRFYELFIELERDFDE